MKGTELLWVSVNPHLPHPAASLVRGFSVINSAFPEQAGWSLNPLYHWGETEHQSPLPLRAAGAQGLGRAVAPRVRDSAIAVKLIKVVVLCPELGCAGWSLWSSSLQCLWTSEHQCRTLLCSGVCWRESSIGIIVSTMTWMLSCGRKSLLFAHSLVNPVNSALPICGF